MTCAGQGGPILQTHLPFSPWDDPALSRMPGMKPVEGHWPVVDDAYAAQMAERVRLMASQRAAVERVTPGSEAVQAELLEVVLASLPGAFSRDRGAIRCPDGRRVETDGLPFDVLGRIVQEDLLLLERRGGEYVLVAGLLCFPASWTLAEKVGRPLSRIHRPVAQYDTPMAARVQALFDRVPAGRPMWRANALGYVSPDLHQPRTEADPKEQNAAPRYLRCERQTVLRLPRTRAVLFAVHTYVVTPDSLTMAQRARCPIEFAV